jgi:hypothetical protein
MQPLAPACRSFWIPSFWHILYSRLPGFNEFSVLGKHCHYLAMAWNLFIGNLAGSLVRMVFQTIELVMMSIAFPNGQVFSRLNTLPASEFL